jgi:UTP--glucose-1-phosphate uridylyltransferase
MKGVLPAAGLGTRLLPATKAQPKEMLPIVDKPTIQYVVEEAAAAGLSEVVIVVGPSKTSIREHFSNDPEMIQRFEKAGKLKELSATLDLIRRIPIRFVTQPEPKGLGDAIFAARHAIGDEDFAVLLGDDIILGEVAATKQLLDLHGPKQRTIIGVQEVPPEDLSRYGVVSPSDFKKRPMPLKDIVEKPAPGAAPSNLAVIGRYVLSNRIFDCLRRTEPGRNGEVQLTDALRLLSKEEPIFALALAGRRLDVGGRLEWLQANIEVALRDARLGPQLREFLKTLR